MRRLAATLAVAVVLPVAACGEEDVDEPAKGPSKLSIVAREQGKRLELEVKGEPAPGITRITFRNEGKKPHSAQLIQVTGKRSQADVIEASKRASDGKPLPTWFFGGGGVGTTAPGETTTVTQDLKNGTYFVIDDEDDNQARGGIAQLEVSGDFRSASLPQGAKLIAEEYTFTATGLKAGSNTVVFSNSGRQPHHLVAAPIRPGKTIADVRNFLKQDDPQGRPPADLDARETTAVLDGGRSLATTFELKKGKYALLCFTSDRKGGPPHVAKGMVSEATVE